ncbi:arginine vasopressin-induced protein 1 [Electrophorus electricus]|uniref:arginine vasopressin-induced protein 1 n=1 Tax=Electrophorus electricus TaxID=8005 RepID=UPI0015D0008E|nr:arginine vasopressin-induced protein 1 [Electrophorus electricus]
MEEVAAAPVPPGGLSQPVFCRPVAPERRIRKSGSANIFQGVNFRQLRRLFQSAGEPDAEQMARLVWGGDDHQGDDNAGEEEDEEGLAQALVRLRVRARNRSGIRAEPHRGDLVAATRGLRSLGHARKNEPSPGQPSEVRTNEPPKAGARDPGQFLLDETRGTWHRNSAVEKDPERYLHRVQH